MKNVKYWALAASIGVGALTALQSRVNGGLSAVLNNGFQAAVISFGSGLILLTLLVVFVTPVRRGLQRIPPAIRAGQIKPWQIAGGLIGGAFVAIQASTVPIVGVAVFTVATVAGQSANSLFVDRLGLGPAGRQAITVARVASAILAVIAVFIAVVDRFGSANFSGIAVALAFLGGVGIAVQQAINGRVGSVSGNPLSAAWVNFAFGASGLVVALIVLSVTDTVQISPLPASPLWLYAGGVIGVLFIATAAWAVQRLGVLLFALSAIAGQLIGALVLDVVAPTAGTKLGWNLVIGVVLTGVAVALTALPKRRRLTG